jgi:hypothetical protein
MPLRLSKSFVEKGSCRSVGTIAFVVAFTPAVDPNNVEHRQVEVPEWLRVWTKNGGLDHCVLLNLVMQSPRL